MNATIIPDLFLESIGVVASSCGFLCCHDCQIAHSPSDMLKHLESHHNCDRRFRNIDKHEFETAIRRCNILAELPKSPFGFDLSPVPGLSVYDGYLCPHCWAGSTSHSGMKKHCQRYHADKPASLATFPLGRLQRFHNTVGPGRVWFRVRAPPAVEPSGVDDMFRDANHALLSAPDINPNTADNVHNITTWLRISRWHIHTKGIDITTARQLVAPPKEPHLAILGKAIVQYVYKCESSIDAAPILIRKRIHSEDPVNRCVRSIHLLDHAHELCGLHY